MWISVDSKPSVSHSSLSHWLWHISITIHSLVVVDSLSLSLSSYNISIIAVTTQTRQRNRRNLAAETAHKRRKNHSQSHPTIADLLKSRLSHWEKKKREKKGVKEKSPISFDSCQNLPCFFVCSGFFFADTC